jgi:hypothetical protein
MYFKGVQTFREKSNKFSKNVSWLDLHTSEFSWALFYARYWVTTQVPEDLVWIKRKEFEFQIQTL